MSRRVLVTGASSGIGRATASLLSDSDWRVAALARRVDRLESLVGCSPVPADLRDPGATRSAVAGVISELGGLDAVVNAAGVTRPGPIETTDYSDWKDMFDTNVLGLLTVCQAAIPALRESDSGHIVNVSSMSGHRILSYENTVYGSTKFAVQAISEGLRKEVAPDSIRVSVVSPGYVRGTEIHARRREAEARSDAYGLALQSAAEAIVWMLEQPADVQVQQVDVTSVRQPSGPMRRAGQSAST